MSLRTVMIVLVNFSVIEVETRWKLGDLLVYTFYLIFTSLAFGVVCGHA